MGQYDKEIADVFNYIEKLNTRVYTPEEFSFLYKQLCSSTTPNVDIELLCQELNTLLDSENIVEIKSKIHELLEQLNSELYSPRLDIGILAAEYLAMSCKQLALQYFSLHANEFIVLAADKQLQKNVYYGDMWYKRGIIGVCRDMGRKIIRINNIHSMIVENKEDALDNIIYLVIFCVFYIVLAREKKK